MQDEEDNSPAISSLTEVPIFNWLRQRYLPAASIAEASVYFTTAEIRNKVMEHTGLMCSYKDIFNWMTDTGYKFDDIGGDLSFVWLLKDIDTIFED